jgi:hypothetical protein
MAKDGRDETGDEDLPPEPKTYDPNANAVWPIYPPGTRLPVRPLSRGLKVTLYFIYWVLLPAAIAGAVFAVLYIRHLEGK